MLLEAFQHTLNQNFSFLKGSKLLLAVSGGLDSVVLLHLCKVSSLDIAVAHCNFNLRDEESDGDERFVRRVCKESKIPCFAKDFDTYAFAKANTLSIQMAARELRYKWFDSLLAEEGFDYVLTAHHKNDSLETFLINVSRGTGLKGLTGIPAVNGTIVRPLLDVTRDDIYSYATSNNISWREDSSNASDNYVRNHLRHHAIPALEAATPQIKDGFSNTQKHLQQAKRLLEVYKSELQERFTYRIDSILGPSGVGIDIKNLKTHREEEAVLYMLLQDFGFTAWEDIYDLCQAQSGKQIYSRTHRLIKSRDCLELFPKKQSTPDIVYVSKGQVKASRMNSILLFDEADALGRSSKNEMYVDYDRLIFPLEIRGWKEGDFFYPIGMKGKKKLSKYFKDEKLSLVAKENIQLLCSDDKIVWVIGMRPDDRFKVTDQTKTILKISYTNDAF